jgi:hypothetical protein
MLKCNILIKRLYHAKVEFQFNAIGAGSEASREQQATGSPEVHQMTCLHRKETLN